MPREKTVISGVFLVSFVHVHLLQTMLSQLFSALIVYCVHFFIVYFSFFSFLLSSIFLCVHVMYVYINEEINDFGHAISLPLALDKGQQQASLQTYCQGAIRGEHVQVFHGECWWW